MANFTIGCDPEIFLRNKKTGMGFSAHGMVPGTKEEPTPNEFGALQVDGLALEFNTTPVPIHDFAGFNNLIIGQIKSIRALADENLSLAIEPVMDFDPEHLDAQPDEAKELGCDPDWNAYTEQLNPTPDAKDVYFRSGAGHIHIGWGADIPIDNPEHISICAGFVKMLDCTVGLAMTVLDPEPRRRELYGKAGAFRPKPYGVEYRTPSNVWIVNRTRRQIIHSLVMMAIDYHKMGRNSEGLCSAAEETIRHIIDTGDAETALNKLEYFCSYEDFQYLRSEFQKNQQTKKAAA